MTDNEIIKVLEDFINHNGHCVNCPSIMKNSLDLINRLQEENERLKETTKNMSAYVKGNRWGLVSFVEFCKNLKAEAYKECIEKVKELFPKEDWFTREALDALLKELVGE